MKGDRSLEVRRSGRERRAVGSKGSGIERLRPTFFEGDDSIGDNCSTPIWQVGWHQSVLLGTRPREPSKAGESVRDICRHARVRSQRLWH